MNQPTLTLRIQRREITVVNGQSAYTRALAVLDDEGRFDTRFQYMCAAIHNDIPSVEGAGLATLDAVRRVETGKSAKEELAGNAWYTFVTPTKVWFEGQHSQGAGGEVTLSQFKFAVETYLQYLADPKRELIEVAFPPDEPRAMDDSNDAMRT